MNDSPISRLLKAFKSGETEDASVETADGSLFADLEARLGHTFSNKTYVIKALTHSSFHYENPDTPGDYERLEFLGDAVLDLAAAEYLFREMPDAPEGLLTRLRSKVTSGMALLQVANLIGLDDYLRVGKGEQADSVRESIRTDAMEAIIGAAYLDGGLEAANRIFRRHFLPILETRTLYGEENPKGGLQEYCQQKWKTSPKYRLVSEEGLPHERVFTVEVSLKDKVLATGTGSSKQAAQIAAAREALSSLGETD